MKLISSSFVERQWRSAMGSLALGTLEFVAPNGEVTIARGRGPGPRARFEIAEWDVLRRISARGDIGLGEEYVAGNWRTDDIEQLVSLFLINIDKLEGFSDGNVLSRIGFVLHNTLARRNSVAGAARNIRAHYDVGNEFYSLWLDRSMTYSSALYDGAETLEAAQQRKYGRILSRLGCSRASLLEIGCGWGGFAARAVQEGHKVVGLTISPAQHAYACSRLGQDAEIRLEDYRDANGTFDAVVSIEMFEAVGERYWPCYFSNLAKRLRSGGRAVIQTIVISNELFDGYRLRSDFIRHYVFPGGMLPSLKRFREEAERAGLKLTDVFQFGHDYGRTLREWSRRMMTRTAEICALGYDDRFLRNWQYYLGICAAAFAVGRTDVVQVELVKS